jgi:hypothetical protein
MRGVGSGEAQLGLAVQLHLYPLELRRGLRGRDVRQHEEKGEAEETRREHGRDFTGAFRRRQ